MNMKPSWKHKLSPFALILLLPLAVLFNVLLLPFMLLDPKARKFNKLEAQQILADQMRRYRQLPYDELRAKFVDEQEIDTQQITGDSGVEYQTEI